MSRESEFLGSESRNLKGKEERAAIQMLQSDRIIY